LVVETDELREVLEVAYRRVVETGETSAPYPILEGRVLSRGLKESSQYIIQSPFRSGQPIRLAVP
jgi:hypothetical protein